MVSSHIPTCGLVSFCFDSLDDILKQGFSCTEFSTVHTTLQAQGVGTPASASSRRVWDSKLTRSSVHLSSLLWSMPFTSFLFHNSISLHIPRFIQAFSCSRAPFPSNFPKDQAILQAKPWLPFSREV